MRKQAAKGEPIAIPNDIQVVTKSIKTIGVAI
jgi:hypothetical protein